MFSFLRALKNLVGATAEEAAIALRAEKTGLHAFDEMMASIEFTENEFGSLKIGEMHAGEFNTIMRYGELKDIFEIQKVKIPFTAVDEKMFRETMADLAEFRSKNIDILSDISKKTYPHLDVHIENVDDIAAATKRDIEKMESKAASKFGTGVKIGLFIGVITLSAGWIVENLRARRGCHMITVLDHKVTSCKIQAHTCLPEVTNRGVEICNAAQINEGNYFNVTVVLIHLANSNDNTDELKIKVCKAAGIEPPDMNAKLGSLIDTKYKDMRQVILHNKDLIPKFGPCTDVHKDVEKGELPICRMCTPSADPVSTKFIDPSQYANNVTFQCIENPSLIDVISDFTKTTGGIIIDVVTSTIWAILKPILIVVAAIGVVLLLALIGITLIKKQINKPSEPKQIKSS